MSDSLVITLVPCLEDNYAYILESGEDVVVIDPSEFEPVERELGRIGKGLSTIWNTHHHWDHIGGNEKLKQKYGAEVVASTYDGDAGRVPGQIHRVSDGDELLVGTCPARVLETPGHTLGAICFYLEEDKALFTGDTLFLMGCGRLFEGTPGQLWSSIQRLRGLADDTRVYCGHEYTVSNGEFLQSIRRDAVRASTLEEATQKRNRGEPTVGNFLGNEKKVNDFLRADSEDVREALGLPKGTPADQVFAELRSQRDHW